MAQDVIAGLSSGCKVPLWILARMSCKAPSCVRWRPQTRPRSGPAACPCLPVVNAWTINERKQENGVHIGIDPGLSGALAVLAADGTLVGVYDTPVLSLRTSRGTKQEYDVPGLVALLAPYAVPQAHVLLEESQAMPDAPHMFTSARLWRLAGHSGRAEAGAYPLSPPRLETPPGAEQGQRTGPAQSHAAFPRCRFAPAQRPRES